MKTATVNIRINEDVKLQAEKILEEIGLTRATAIDIFYRQIILNKGLPFTLSTTPQVLARDMMSEEELHSLLATGYEEARRGEGEALDAVVNRLKAEL